MSDFNGGTRNFPSANTPHAQRVKAAAWVIGKAGDDEEARDEVLGALGLDLAELRAGDQA